MTVLKSVSLIAIVTVAMVGVMVPSVFGQSIIDEKDCKIIGEELDSNIECRYILKTPEGLAMDRVLNVDSAQYYDQERNILYFGPTRTMVFDQDGDGIEITEDAWKHNYVGVELDNFTIVDQLHCEPIITGTYKKIVTYPCKLELQIELKDHKLVLPSKIDWNDHPNAFVQYEENIIFAEKNYSEWGNENVIALFDYNGNKIRWLHDEPSHARVIGEWNNANANTLIVSQTKTTTPYIYYAIMGDGKSYTPDGGLHVMQGEKPFSILHSYNTDIKSGGKIFLNEDKNQVYYFVNDMVYKIKGMGTMKSTEIASFVDQTKDPQHYIDRYDNEPEYKEWFDENYPQYFSIYEAVGLEESIIEQINEPEYVSEPKTTIVSCSNDVKITPDKDVHQSGETITFTVETFDPCYVDNYRELRLYIVGYDRPNCDGCRIIESFLIKTGEPKIFQFYPEILNWSQEYYVRQGIQGSGFGDLLKYDSKGNLVLNENDEIQNLSFIVLPAEQDKKIISVPMCGTGTELVNGVCELIQTEEKSSGGGCLIATATYGSEMSPQVQQLRELRDNQLMNTESGTAFITTFNDIYYSFSPIIADYERENPYFKEVVKLAITPMITSLSLMENAESESEVLSIGISVIMLNLGMYLGVPAVVIIGIKRRI